MKSRRGWPPILCEIADHVGEPAALALVVHFGGMEMFVPRTAGPEHRFTQVLGAERAAVFCAAFGGDKIAVPTARTLRSAKMAIIDALTTDSALGTSALAHATGVTARHVRAVKREIGQDDEPDQLKLL
jgi:hypothetical protein